MHNPARNTLILVLFTSLSACSASTHITNTSRSTVEQHLLVQALERAVAKLDIRPIVEKTISVEFYGLTADKDFAREYCVAQLQQRGIKIANDFRAAQLRVKVFANVLGVDQGQAFLGVPAVTVPVLGFTVPEVALFKSNTHHGHAEVEVYVLDGASGDFIAKIAPADGEAVYDQYTILIAFNFSHTDLDQ